MLVGMDSRQKLIEATQELFWERGYTATSPKAIQAAAGVGQGSMYHHFQGKPGLGVAAIEASAAVMRRDAIVLLEGPGSPLDRIRSYLTRPRHTLRGCRIGRLTADPDVVADERLLAPVQENFAWLVDVLTDLLRQAQQAGDLQAELNALDLASTLVAVIQGGYVLARAAQSPEPFDRAVAGAMFMIDHLTTIRS